MALTFHDGFETGGAEAWDSVQGSPTFVAAAAHTGGYGMRCNASGSPIYVSNAGLAKPRITFYLYITNTPSAECVIAGDSGASVHDGNLRLTDDGYLKLYDGATLKDTGDTQLSTGTWYRISFASGVGSFKIYLNGTEECTAVSGSKIAPFLGVLSSVTTNLDFDDFAEESTITADDIGDIRTLAARPIGEGTDQDTATAKADGWVDSTETAVAKYTELDTDPPSIASYNLFDGAATKRYSVTMDECGEGNLADIGGSDEIVGIHFMFLYGTEGGGADDYGSKIIVSDGTLTDDNIDDPKDPTWLNLYHADTPQGGNPWTQAYVNSIEMGMAGVTPGSKGIWFYEAYAMVAFKVVSGGVTVSPTTLELAATLHAPTVSFDVTVTPDTLALALTQHAPTVTTAVDCTVTPDALELALTLEASATVWDSSVLPDCFLLAVDLPPPVIFADATVTPDTLALALTSETPTVFADATATPTTLALALTQHTPAVLFPIQTILPDALALALTQHAPGVVIDCTVVPDTLALALTQETPTILADAAITPVTLELALTLQTPTVTTGADVTVTPTTLALALTQETPTVFADAAVTPTTFALALAQQVPTITWDSSVLPVTLELALTLQTPTVLFPIQIILPSTLELAATLHAPTIDVGLIVSITTWAELEDMRNDLTKDYALDANLDKYSAGYDTYAGPAANGGTGWNPVGIEASAFLGGFDGQDHSLSDIFIDRDDLDVGLFGFSKSGTGIKNIRILNCDITGGIGYSVGGVVGYNHWDAAPMSNCSCTGTIGSVSGGDFVGGIVGTNYGDLSNCCSYEIAVTGDHDSGGIAGYNQGDLDNCYSHGTITGNEYAGGLIGYRAAGAISKCYSTGLITGLYDGGLIGGGTGGTVTDCFWDTETSEQVSSAGGTGKTTAQMQDVDTFTETDTPGLTNPWDFVGNPNDDVGNEDYWDIDNYYPFLTVLGDPYVLIEPTTLALALTLQTPTVFPIITITPDTFELAATLQVPYVFDIITVTPDTFELIVTLQAPTVDTGTLIDVTTLALALALQTPSIVINFTATPATFALEATLLAPDAMSGYPEMTPAMHAALIDPYAGGAWLWLAEIYIPGYNLIRIARNTEDVVYAGITYTANNFEIGLAAQTGDSSVPRYGLQVSQDADHTLEDKINATQGACGGWVKIIRAHEDYLTYFIEELEQIITILSAGSDTEHVSFALGIPDPLIRKIPLRRYSSKMCPYALPGLFKGIECGYSGGDSVCTGKFTDCVTKGNSTRWGGEIGLDPNVARV